MLKRFGCEEKTLGSVFRGSIGVDLEFSQRGVSGWIFKKKFAKFLYFTVSKLSDKLKFSRSLSRISKTVFGPP